MDRESNFTTRGTSFDELTKLSPAELEALRRREVDSLINQAPERVRNRLRGLQFEIDARRRLHKSPLASCICISQMMQESLERLNAALHGEPLPERRERGEVVPFPHARQNHRDRPRV